MWLKWFFEVGTLPAIKGRELNFDQWCKAMSIRIDDALGVHMRALAAYNAGPARVDQWLKSNGDPRQGTISVSQWVERIPFKETRNYTRSILADLGRPGIPLKLQSAVPHKVGLQPDGLEFKSRPDPVASTGQDITSTVSRAAELRSPAFAPNMRVARKEIES